MRNLMWLSLFFAFAILDCHAYVWEECNKDVYQPVRKFFHQPGGAQAGVLTVTTGAPTSSSQFASSTGGCSAILKKEDEVKNFVYSNYNELMFDISRGSGEYLTAYTELLKCEEKKYDQFSVLLQKNFTNIYGMDHGKEPEDIFNSLESFSLECSLKI